MQQLIDNYSKSNGYNYPQPRKASKSKPKI